MSVTKKDLINRTAEIIRSTGYRKKIQIPKHYFTISDDEGNSKRFYVKGKVKEYLLNAEDVAVVIDACMECIWDTLSKGEEININGIGSLGVKYRAGGRTKQFETGEWIDIEPRYVPYFTASDKLKTIARLYGVRLDEEAHKEELFSPPMGGD